MSAVESVRWSADGGAVDIIDQRLLPGPARAARAAHRGRGVRRDRDARRARRAGDRRRGSDGARRRARAARRRRARRVSRRASTSSASASRACGPPRSTWRGPSVACWRVAQRDGRRRARRSSPRCATRRRAFSTRTARCAAASASTGCRLLGDGARVLTHCNAGALATGGDRHGARAGVRRRRARTSRRRVRRRDAAAAAGKPPHRVGACRRPASTSRCSPTAWRRRSCATERSTSCSSARIASPRTATSRTRSAPIRSRSRRAITACRSTSRRRGAPSIPRRRPDDEIVIEHAPRDELRRGFASPVAPRDVAVYNPAFDVTPAELVTAFVTDRGVIRPPYRFEHARHAGSVAGVGNEDVPPPSRALPSLADRARRSTARASPPAAAAATRRRSCRSSRTRARRARCSSARRRARSRPPAASRSPAAPGARSSAGWSAPGSTSRPRATCSTSRRSPAAIRGRIRPAEATACRRRPSVRDAPTGWTTSSASSGRRWSSPSVGWRSTASSARSRSTRSIGREHEIEARGGRADRDPAAASERREQLGASAGEPRPARARPRPPRRAARDGRGGARSVA